MVLDKGMLIMYFQTLCSGFHYETHIGISLGCHAVCATDDNSHPWIWSGRFTLLYSNKRIYVSIQLIVWENTNAGDVETQHMPNDKVFA